ncbi:phage tail tube protein [Sphingomonas hankookensis]|uniref:phage tail tube protein n=1 Tax=Sphingomonas hankookensis TaxID=563996 RepID=UPI003D302903
MADANGNSEAQIGWGSEFWLANAAGVLTELDEVTEIPFAEETADDVEVTHFKSPGRRKEYKAGLIEPGEGTLTVNYLPGSATDVLLRAAHNDGKTRAYKAVIPDGDGTWEVEGFLIVKSRARAVPIGDRMTQSISVRFTGGTEEAAGA